MDERGRPSGRGCGASTPRTQVDHADAKLAAVARGIVQHHDDDDWFHRTTAFFEVSQQLTAIVADVIGADERARPSFLGHILTEIVLDANLIAAAPDQLDAYYAAFDTIDPDVIETAVAAMNGRRLPQISQWVPRFTAEGFLRDYGDDERLRYRLNQVMRRVGLPQLSDEFSGIIPQYANWSRGASTNYSHNPTARSRPPP